MTRINPFTALAGFPDAWRTSRRWSAEDVTPFEKMRILDPAPNPKFVKQAAADFAALLNTIREHVPS